MAWQKSVAARNAQLDAFETSVGASPVMEIRTGAPPEDCADASTGDVLATLSLPSDWMNAASNGEKTKAGTWEDTSADDDGTAGHFRIFKNDGTTCMAQGTITETGGGGDMEVNNTDFATGQSFTVTSFTLTALHA